MCSSAQHARRWIWLTLLASLLLAPSCRRPGSARKHGDDRGQKLLPDTLFGGTDPVRVLEIPCEHALVFTGPEISGTELPAAAGRRERWVVRSRFTSRVLLHPKRLVWELPKRALPGGDSEQLYLILQPDSNTAVVVSHKRKVFWADTPAQLAAWIEGALKPSPRLQRVEVLGRTSEGPRSRPDGPGVGLPVRMVNGLVVLRQRGHGQANRPLRYNVRSRALAVSALGGVGQGQSLLWDFALLPFVGTTDAKELAPLRGRQQWPLQIELRPARSQAAAIRAPWLRLRLKLDPRQQQRRMVPPKLLRMPPGPGYRRLFGPLTNERGQQLQRRPRGSLVKRRPGDPKKATLKVKNPGRRAAYVYADGVLLGRVGPRQQFTFDTTEPGYFRVVARTLFGTAMWGPRDLFVPGTMTLKAR